MATEAEKTAHDEAWALWESGGYAQPDPDPTQPPDITPEQGEWTKGPWSVDGFTGCQLITKDRPFAQGAPIGIGKIYSENMIADARLIAAAPCMADAAQRLLAVFDQQKMTNAERIIVGVSDADLRKRGNAAIADLRAALAKATSK